MRYFLSGYQFYSRQVISNIICRKYSLTQILRKETSKETKEPHVILERVNESGVITLNRPKQLNVLDLDMIRKIHPKLLEWEADPEISSIIIRGSGDKAFCAGGDIKSVVEGASQPDPREPARRLPFRIGKGTLSDRFFREEYELNYAIAKCTKPYIALIDGIVIGGGVGLSIHGKYRVATERSLFAMPETNIGLIPDVGASYFLPRLRNSTPNLGLFLALTNGRLRGADLKQTGIATHYVQSTQLNHLYNALVSLKKPNQSQIVDEIVRFEKASGYKPAPHNFTAVEPKIAKLFRGESLDLIIKDLEYEASQGDAWAREQLNLILKYSPTSSSILVRQLRTSAAANFLLRDAFALEFRLIQHIFQDADIYEGVSALLIDKKRPANWRPSSYKDVTATRLDWYFSPLSPDYECLVTGKVSQPAARASR